MNAIKNLESLAWITKKARHPEVPEYALVRPRYSDATANGLTRCILVWLELKRHYAVRVTTTGCKLNDMVITDVIGRRHVDPGKWIPGTTRRGTADIHAVIAG